MRTALYIEKDKTLTALPVDLIIVKNSVLSVDSDEKRVCFSIPCIDPEKLDDILNSDPVDLTGFTFLNEHFADAPRISDLTKEQLLYIIEQHDQHINSCNSDNCNDEDIDVTTLSVPKTLTEFFAHEMSLQNNPLKEELESMARIKRHYH